MAKCPDELKQLIISKPVWFENSVVACSRTSLDLFKKLRMVLCLYPDTEKHVDDFETNNNNNIIYAGIRDYNNMFIKSNEAAWLPMTEEWLQHWLLNKACKAELVAKAEIPDVIEHFRNSIVPFPTSASSIGITQMGVASYLRSVRAKRIINRVSLNGADLEDLALQCEHNVEFINRIDGDVALNNTLPAGIDFNDTPIFDDPNKALCEMLESDIPALNAAMGGFRKGCAYMVIGSTGSGKTICACQLASSFSYTGNYGGIYISTEQSHEDLRLRIISNCCRIQHASINRGIFQEQLTARETEAYIDFRSKCRALATGRIHFANWGNAQSMPGVSVTKKIEYEIEEYFKLYNKYPSYLILDWIGGALGQMADSPDKVRLLYQDTADALELLARKHNIVTVAFAQAHINAVNKLNIGAADLAECKSMPRNYSGIIGITSMYSEEHAKCLALEQNKKRRDFRMPVEMDEALMYSDKQFFSLSKCRYGVQRNVPYKRLYEYQRMEPWR